MESCTFLGVNFQKPSLTSVSKIWKPSKNHWKQWSGGWKSLNGDGWMTPKPLKNHQVQWPVSKKGVNGDGQRVAKPLKNHWCQWFSRKKKFYPIAPKNDHCSPLNYSVNFSYILLFGLDYSFKKQNGFEWNSWWYCRPLEQTWRILYSQEIHWSALAQN